MCLWLRIAREIIPIKVFNASFYINIHKNKYANINLALIEIFNMLKFYSRHKSSNK